MLIASNAQAMSHVGASVWQALRRSSSLRSARHDRMKVAMSSGSCTMPTNRLIAASGLTVGWDRALCCARAQHVRFQFGPRGRREVLAQLALQDVLLGSTGITQETHQGLPAHASRPHSSHRTSPLSDKPRAPPYCIMGSITRAGFRYAVGA